jgi:hypothetical protein
VDSVSLCGGISDFAGLKTQRAGEMAVFKAWYLCENIGRLRSFKRFWRIKLAASA